MAVKAVRGFSLEYWLEQVWYDGTARSRPCQAECNQHAWPRVQGSGLAVNYNWCLLYSRSEDVCLASCAFVPCTDFLNTVGETPHVEKSPGKA